MRASQIYALLSTRETSLHDLGKSEKREGNQTEILLRIGYRSPIANLIFQLDFTQLFLSMYRGNFLHYLREQIGLKMTKQDC